MTPSEQAEFAAARAAGAPLYCCVRTIDSETEKEQARTHSFEPGRGIYHCAGCQRDFALAQLYVDDSCIEALDYEFFRVVDAGEQASLLAQSPDGSFDLSAYIMNQGLYFARNRAAGGAFQRAGEDSGE